MSVINASGSYPNSSSYFGIAVPDPTVNNTKGLWVEVIASTSLHAHGFSVSLFTGGGDNDVLFDIGIGSSGSEAVLVGNVYSQDNNATGQIKNFYYFPVAISPGNRLAMRQQSTSTNMDMNATLLLCRNINRVPFENLTPTTYGADTSDSGGTQVDPGATIHTKGAYSIVASSIADRIDWLYVNIGNKNNGAMTSAYWRCDIAIGLNQETIVVADLPFAAHGNHDLILPQVHGPFPVEIPSGARIAVRAQSNTADATDRLFDVSILGFSARWRRARRLN